MLADKRRKMLEAREAKRQLEADAANKVDNAAFSEFNNMEDELDEEAQYKNLIEKEIEEIEKNNHLNKK